MKKSVKAALLSGFLYPGIGQISIGHKIRGVFFALVNSVFMILFLQKIMLKTHQIVEEIQKSGVIIDLHTISNMTSEIMRSTDNSTMNIYLWIIVFAWAISIIDAYYLGLKLDKA